MASSPISIDLIPSANEAGSRKSGNLTEYYEALGNWCDAAAEEAFSAHKDVPELKEMSLALDYLMGQQWKEAMPSYRAKPVSNEILTMFWETIGLLTDLKPMFKIVDIGGEGNYSQIGDILNKLANGWADNSRFRRTMAFSTMFAMLTSAPAKVYWNPFAKGFSGDPSDGDISFEALPADSIGRLGINDDDDYQSDECVIYRRVRTIDWIRRAYPNMGRLVQPEEEKSKFSTEVQSPINVMPQMFQNLSPAGKRLMGGGEKSTVQSIYPKSEIREFWKKDDSINESRNIIRMGPRGAAWAYEVKPGQKIYPRGRLIVRANNVTLYDEPNPYFHRKVPFAKLGLYTVPWQQYAMSVIKPWMSQQDILNQILSGVIQNIKKAINPPLIASRASITPENLRAIDSSKPNLKITHSANGAPPTWGKPPDLPGYVLQTYGLMQNSMKQTSGSAAADAAAGKKQVPGGDTLDKLTFAKNTPIRLMGRNIEDFTDDIGGMWSACALQFYDAAARMEMLGEKGLSKEDMDDRPGSLIPEGINSESFVRRWKFKCNKSTLLNVQRQDKIQIAFALRKNKDLSRAGLYEVLDWNIDQKKNDDQLSEEMKQVAAAMAAAGAHGKGGHK